MQKNLKLSITKFVIFAIIAILVFGTIGAIAFTANADDAVSADPVFSIYDGQYKKDQSYDKLYDDSFDTKYCISIKESPYIVFKAEQEGSIINGYTLYTANDTEKYSGRNPKNWKVSGSNDSIFWTVLHNVENDDTLEAANKTGYDFTFENSTPYRFYKFEFLARHGADGEDGNTMQLSEIKLNAIIGESTAQEVGDAESLAEIFNNGGRARLTADIELNDGLSVYAKSVEVDLNGHILSGSRIDIWAASPSGHSVLVIIDSDPNATHSDESLPNGGVIESHIEFNRKNTADQKDEDYNNKAYLFADGGSVINSLHSSTGSGIISHLDCKMTHFLGGVSGVKFKLNGGIFYDKIEDSNGVAFDTYTDVERVTFSYVENNVNKVHAYEYVKAGSTLTIPVGFVSNEENVRFDGWYVGSGYLSDSSAVITASANSNAIMTKDVDSSETFNDAIKNGYSVRLTADISIISENDIDIFKNGSGVVLDLNGHVITITNAKNARKSLKLVGANISSSFKTSLIVIDSNPTASHTDSDLPEGGYINCEINMEAYWGTKEVAVFANGGTIRKVYSNSGAGGVWSTSTTPSVIQEVGETGGITINGGVYYWNLGRLGGNKLTFKNGDTVYAVAATYASTMVAPKTPAKEGYSFEGWYNGNTLYDFNTPITSALTLTAKWKDIVAPVVSGVDADSVYCQEIEVSVADSSSFTVTVNEAEVTVTDNKFNLDMSDGVDKTIVVTDIDGNMTTITAKFGHSFGELAVEVPATCTQDGVKAYKDCSVCNKHFDTDGKELASIVIEAKGHNYGELVVALNPTCTEKGHVAYYHCSACDKYFDSEKVEKAWTDLEIVANGHTFGDMIDEVSATCTEVGAKAHKDCSVCKEHFDAEGKVLDIVIAAKGHKLGELVAEVPATCTQDGVKAYKDCSVCNKHFDTDGKELSSIVIEAKGHNLIKVSAKAATVDAEGNIEYYRCDGCNKLFKDDKGANEIEASAIVVSKIQLEISKVENENVDASQDGLSFKGNGNISNKEIKVNGEIVDSANYTVTEDNVIVLNPDYLASLGNGEHVLSVGDANIDFTVDFVKEGLSGGAIAGIAIAAVVVLALGGFAIFWFVIKKKSFNDLVASFKKK